MVEAKVRYEEAGREHRYFLGWRHAAFAGYLVGAFTVLSLAIQTWEKSALSAGLLLVAAAPVGVIMLFADLRIRQLYFDAVQAGKALEVATEVNEGGVFTNLLRKADERPKDPGWGTHTVVGALIYVGYSLAFLISGVVVLACR